MTARLSIVSNTKKESRQLRDQPLLAFARNGTPLIGNNPGGAYEVSFGDAARNIIIFGGTGRGKTDAVLFPAASKLIETGCLGLILDAKGEFTALAEEYPKETMLIGPETGNAINLIGGIETPTFRAIIEDLQSRYHENERYWGMTGIEDAVLVFLAIREMGRTPTLRDIHHALTKPDKFSLSLERWLCNREEISEELLSQIETL